MSKRSISSTGASLASSGCTSEIAVEFFRIGFVSGVERYRVMAEAADRWQATTRDRPRYRSIAHAITCNWDQLQSTKLNLKRLAAIRDGSQKPTETELLRLALALGISEQDLESLPLLDGESTNAALLSSTSDPLSSQ
ncbi:hypothetical protein H6F90_03990 [Trichocoleus sp. FACHB-591]|uniref:hypothetical protein n=1 Tax=Trichocoleus sp. FACHB-591 TaxID=2692872 RepID=UPI0016858CB8|nr:hypothetical protein [Trichocoleus sp. FACHB-591]MBD2094309.1 hypothetical protein [Trichocoleus sp. FACHB-591]